MPFDDLAAMVRTAARAGLVRPIDPRKLLGAQRALARWGPSLAGAFAAAVALDPDGTFLVDERGSLTRRQMDRRSNALANGLRARGIASGDVVGVMARNHRGFIEATMALAKLGARTLYLNTGFAAPQLREVIARERPAAVIYDEEFHDLIGADAVSTRVLSYVEHLETASGTADTIDAIIAASADTEPARPAAAGAAIILTSGTTGTPKGAARSESTDARTGVAMLERIPYHYGDTTLIPAPLFHSWGFANLLTGILLNATVVLRRRFDPETVLADIAAHRVSTLAVVPVMLQRILELPDDVRARYDASSLRVVALSGSSIPPGIVTRWMDTYGDNVYNLYGSTEVGWAAIATPEDLRADPATAGRPPRYTSVRLLDDRGRAVATGERGRIFVKSPLLFGGYTDGQNKEIIGGYMSTGDTGRFDVAGRLRVEGRDDDMIVSGGENVFPREVEDLLAGHPDVDDVAVVGVPDEEFGQRLAAFVVRRKGSKITAAALRRFVGDNLARFKLPRDVTFVEEIPRNATGKILRRELPV